MWHLGLRMATNDVCCHAAENDFGTGLLRRISTRILEENLRVLELADGTFYRNEGYILKVFKFCAKTCDSDLELSPLQAGLEVENHHRCDGTCMLAMYKKIAKRKPKERAPADVRPIW